MNQVRPKVVIIGAGASGRGHVGQLASESGYELVFLDKDRSLTDRLRAAGRYRVRLVGEPTRDVTIEQFAVYHLDEVEAFYREFREASFVFTAVRPANLKDVAAYLRPLMVRWLSQAGRDDYKNVLCCENMNNGSTAFKALLCDSLCAPLRRELEARVGFPDAMIARIVTTPTDPLELLGEDYSEWTAARGAFRGPELPLIKTLEIVDNHHAYLQRKLYIHNTGHATLGYLGHLKGYTYVHEAGSDPDIMAVTGRAIEESGWAIQKEHGFSETVMRDYRKLFTDKCACAELPDEIARVVRDPLRKLGPDERFFGPVRLMLKHGREPQYLLYGLCGALLADVPGDAASQTIRRTLERHGLKALLEELHVSVPAQLVQSIERLLPHVQEKFGRPA